MKTTMKKSLARIFAILLVCMTVCFAGCTTRSSMAFTYNVDTGDTIKVALDTAAGHTLSAQVPFTVSLDGEALTQGTFIYADAYQDYVDVVDADEKAELLESGSKDGNDYIFWCYDGVEYNYAILVGGSNTGVILSNTVSEESARECFNRLAINVDD